jgi:GNAT superfamily N-acetyltransferase
MTVTVAPLDKAADLAEVSAFQERVSGGSDSTRMEWLHRAQPLIVARDQDKIVGLNGSLPFSLKVGDAECPARWGVDLMLDQEFRGRGIGSALHAEARRGFRVSCALGMSPAGEAHARRSGYLPVAVVSTYVSIPRVVVPMARRRTSQSVVVAEFDDRTDEIWNDASPSHAVLAKRDLAALRWRFDEHPHRNLYARYYLLRDDRPVAYFVLRPTIWRGVRASVLVDYLAPPDEMTSVFAAARVAARDDNAKALLCTTLNPNHGRLGALGFVRLPGRKFSFFVAPHHEESQEFQAAVTDPKQWFLTAADSDVDLCDIYISK